MRLRDYVAIFFIIIVVGALIWGSVKFLGHDNPLEERIEKLIEEETGVDIDFTPSTPENKPKPNQQLFHPQKGDLAFSCPIPKRPPPLKASDL